MTKSKTIRKKSDDPVITSVAEFNRIYFPKPSLVSELDVDPFKLGEQAAREMLASLTKDAAKARRKAAS